MLKFLLKSAAAKTIFSVMKSFVSVLSVVLMLSGSAFAELDIPIPADLPDREHKIDGKTVSPPIKQFQGVDRSPPFDLSKAKACEAELKKRGINFILEKPITDPRGCTAERPLKLKALGSYKLSNEIVARCQVALAFDDLIEKVMAPSAEIYLETQLVEIGTSTSYHCRTRNNKPGAKVSEHGFANALDIASFHFADGAEIKVAPTDELPQAQFLAAVTAGACAFFTTVLGPGSDASHMDHMHMDLAYRKSGYRLCQ